MGNSTGMIFVMGYWYGLLLHVAISTCGTSDN
jgi:hypothetical protein